MTAHSLKCPACDARLDMGTEFLISEDAKAQRHGQIVSDSGGTLVIEAMDVTMEPTGRCTISCRDCGYEWKTRRDIDRYWGHGE